MVLIIALVAPRRLDPVMFIFLVLMITTGAISISQALKDNQTLLELFMMENDIGDDGIRAIAISLNNSSITVLHVRNCGITYDGVSSLAKVLSANKKIKTLGLWNNPITVNGARVIMESAVDNKISEHILIDSEHQNDDKVKEMMSILDDRKRKVRN